ncbi:DoxX family protein [Planktotalea sp.]|uniref:DoxX family protein n=1 Tax=Planktotalea sp. TaxID=2029877 RepID=UPI0035C81BCE
MKYLSLGLRALLTLAFVGAGGAKLAGVEMMVATYDAIGVGQWFRYLTGIIEIGAAALLWLPGVRRLPLHCWVRRWSALCLHMYLSLDLQQFQRSFLALSVQRFCICTAIRSTQLWGAPLKRPTSH